MPIDNSKRYTREAERELPQPGEFNVIERINGLTIQTHVGVRAFWDAVDDTTPDFVAINQMNQIIGWKKDGVFTRVPFAAFEVVNVNDEVLDYRHINNF